MNWIQSLMMGLVTGFCEPSPVSAEAHRGLLRHLFGIESEGPLFLFLCHTAVLLVMLSAGKLELRRLRRTARLLKTPKRRRTGHFDLNSAGTNRMIRSAAVFAIAGGVLSISLDFLTRRMWVMTIPLAICALLLWLPTQFRTANKDGRHLSAVEGAVMGLGVLASAVPGISAVGAVTAIGSMLGAERRFALRFAWILLCRHYGPCGKRCGMEACDRASRCAGCCSSSARCLHCHCGSPCSDPSGQKGTC